jgi:uncharacterized protein YcbX
MPTVARLNVTPVKSTALHNPERIRLERFGAVGNREFFFVGEDGRRFSGARKTPLIPIRAEYEATEDHLSLRLPDGIVVGGSAAPNGESLTVDFYGRPVPAHVIEGEWEEALTRYAGHVVRLARVDRPGDAIDVKPVTLVSLAAVADGIGRSTLGGSACSSRSTGARRTRRTHGRAGGFASAMPRSAWVTRFPGA